MKVLLTRDVDKLGKAGAVKRKVVRKTRAVARKAAAAA